MAVDQLYWFRFRFGSGLGSVLVLFPEPKGNKEYEEGSTATWLGHGTCNLVVPTGFVLGCPEFNSLAVLCK